MRFEPRPHQQTAIDFVLDKPAAALWLDMGLGKTVSVLTAINELMYDRFEVCKVLVIAPLRVAEHTWTEEIDKWHHLQHLRMSKVLGSEKERLTALAKEADIYIINRENVVWLVEQYKRKTQWPFDMVVVDESSSFKSHQAKRFRALRKVRPLVNRMVELTGTPAPNGYMDLWSQVYLLDRGERLGKTITSYRERYFEPDKRNRTTIFSWKLQDGAREAIQAKLSDICLSMDSAGIIEPPHYNRVPVHLPEKAMQAYLQLERDLLLPYATGDIVALTAGVLTNKLLQLANGAVYDEFGKAKIIHDAKLDALDDVIESANGQPVMVLYNYRHDLERLQRHLAAYRPRTLDTSQDINDWNAGNIPVLLAHPASMGHGLNLQFGGHTVIWFGLNWSLELYQQANARLARPGQKYQVIVHHLVAQGTYDEIVMDVLLKRDVEQADLKAAIKERARRWR
jgi:SNF2 family DNA or RNA helicase